MGGFNLNQPGERAREDSSVSLYGLDAYVDELTNLTPAVGAFHWSEDCEHPEQLNALHHAVQKATHGCKFMVTKGGSIGLAPPAAHEGHLCGIIFVCVYPCLLRPTQSEPTFQFVGSAQVYHFSCTDKRGDLKSSSGQNKTNQGLWGAQADSAP